MLQTAARYWNTIRHLRPVQLYGRILFRLRRPQLSMGAPAPPRRVPHGTWQRPAERRSSMRGSSTFCFLNDTRDVGSDWDSPTVPKLWRYNLHYFEDLNAEGADSRRQWHKALLERWRVENPPSSGTAWDPYPTSLRIVNWIKWEMRVNALSPEARASLAQQTRWLSQRIEHHLLANHLFANAKALVFSGLFHDGAEARAWLEQGCAILLREIPEQILPDGGQFELSPMYHALAYEDVLDLCNALSTFRDERVPATADLHDRLKRVAPRMGDWLDSMCHPDGEISFFNDASFGIAPSTAALQAYAGRLALGERGETPATRHLRDSGYIRLSEGAVTVIVDVAHVGPDYQPGHAHADTLSFECSLHGQRLFVNSGISTYEANARRQAERGTAAHNTVVVDEQDSSEVWGAFRVARRARPFGLTVTLGARSAVRCSHDGYQRLSGRPVHTREWRLEPGRFVIVDQISGRSRLARGYFYLHPTARVTSIDRSSDHTSMRLQLQNGRFASLAIRGAQIELVESTWSPEFGRSEATRAIVATFSAPTVETTLTWE